MKLLSNRLNSGFTLIELMIVISIIGILSAVVLSSLQDARLEAFDTTVKQEVRHLANLVSIVGSTDADFDFAPIRAMQVHPDGANADPDIILFTNSTAPQAGCDIMNWAGQDKLRLGCEGIESSFDGDSLVWPGSINGDAFMVWNINPSNNQFAVMGILSDNTWFCADSGGRTSEGQLLVSGSRCDLK